MAASDTPLTHYAVNVHVSARCNVDVPLDLYVRLHGSLTETTERRLDVSLSTHSKFQPGQLDSFELSSPQLGEIQSVTLRHDGMAFGSGVLIEHLIIENDESV